MAKQSLGVDQFFTQFREGLAMPNKYRIEFTLPKGIPPLPNSNLGSMAMYIRGNEARLNNGGAISILCHTAILPERMLQVYEHKQNVMPYRVPYSQMYNPVTFTFYANSQMNTRRYFEIWQNAVVNVNDNTMNFYNEYTSDVRIYTLDREGNDAYGVKLIEAFPMSLAGVDLSYANNTAQNVTVTLSYKYWTGIEDDRTEIRIV